jgi:hypothetical protein
MKAALFASAVFAAALVGGGLLSVSEAEAGCVMQRQCRLAHKYVQQVRYQRDCSEFRLGNNVQRSCRMRPVTHRVPVAYQDCSQTRRVCNSLGSLVGSNKRR